MMNNKGKSRFICVFAILVVLIGLGFFVLFQMIQSNRNQQVEIHEVLGSQSYEQEDIYVDISVSKQWAQGNGEIGAQYDGIFYNNSNIDFGNWKIEIEVPENGHIDSSWNGVYEQSGNLITITSVEYNEVIERSGNETFGFVMYTLPGYEVSKVNVYGYKDYKKEDFIFYWILVVLSFVTVMLAIFFIFMELKLRTYRQRQKEDKKIIIQSLQTFANFIDAKDPYTKGHSARVAIYATEIARRMGMQEKDLDKISYIALLHDVGKIGISNEILNKPGKLNSDEIKLIQTHTSIGADILKDFSAIPGIMDGARYHHESYDGHGYPNGLAGEEIPLFSRIICIADSYDAMSSDRCYRTHLSNEEIVKELNRCAGIQFDPRLVKYMIDMIKDGFVNQVTCN